MRYLTARLIAASLLLSLCLAGHAETVNIASSTQAPGTLHTSLAEEVNATVARGLDWLAAMQNESGSWSNDKFPALSALPLRAFIRTKHEKREDVLKRGTEYLLSCVQPDGGIYQHVEGRKGGGLSNYNTAICMTTLHALRDPAHIRLIQNARAFVTASQHLGDDIYKGGFGYDKANRRAYTDLLNTFHAAQAMRLTADVEEHRPPGEGRVDIDWKETTQFIEQMQNKPESGPDHAGGFTYNPTDPKAGTVTNEAGIVVFRSYGSITYVGMLSLIYADVAPSDPRVVSAFDWASRHWSLDENPGMGQNGLYFFYNILTKSLAAQGRDLVPRPKGELVNWRAEVAKKLVSLQKIDPGTGAGYWENETGRYWENDPVLVTAYSLLALQML